MKQFKLYASIFLVAMLFVISCKKKQADRSILSTGNEIVPVLTLNSQNPIVLGMDSADLTAVAMSWTAADWGFPTHINYDVEIIKKGNAWDSAKVYHMVNEKSTSLTHFDLNDVANSFGIAAEQSGELSARIKAFIPGTTQKVYSNVVTKTVTAYKMVKPILTVNPSGIDTINLTKDSANLFAVTMNWTEVNWNNPSTTEYELQVVPMGGNWKDATIFPLGANTYAGLSHKNLNLWLLASGVDTLGVGAITARVKASMPGTTRVAYSDAATRFIRTYPIILATAKLWTPGDYQGWNPAASSTIEETAVGNKMFSGIIEKTKSDGTLSNGEFKFTSDPDWDHTSYGLGVNLGELNTDPNAVNLNLPDGTYLFNVNLNNNTWTNELVNWGLIGNATNNADADGDGTPDGWQSDKNMRYNSTTKMYEITANLVVGEIKFRKNDDWGTNLGGTPNALTAGGSNIPIALDGNYTIQLSVEDNTCIITKN